MVIVSNSCRESICIESDTIIVKFDSSEICRYPRMPGRVVYHIDIEILSNKILTIESDIATNGQKLTIPASSNILNLTNTTDLTIINYCIITEPYQDFPYSNNLQSLTLINNSIQQSPLIIKVNSHVTIKDSFNQLCRSIILPTDLRSLTADNTYSEDDFLKYLGELRHVKLIHMDIGNFSFVNNPMLNTIEINDCYIRHIYSSTVSNLPYLETILISNNRMLETIANNAFSSLPSIKKISIINNSNLESLEIFGCMDSSQLTELELIDNASVDKIESSTFSLLTELKVLKLRGSNIRRLHGDMFDNCTKLERLDLSDNLIEIIDKPLFNRLVSLQCINLSGNIVNSIEYF